MKDGRNGRWNVDWEPQEQFIKAPSQTVTPWATLHAGVSQWQTDGEENVAIESSNTLAETIKNVDSSGKTNAGAGNPIVFLLYSVTGIDSHFTRNGRLGLIGHSSPKRDSLFSWELKKQRDEIHSLVVLWTQHPNRNGFRLIFSSWVM